MLSRHGRNTRTAGAVVLALVAMLFTPPPPSAAEEGMERVSVASDGTQANKFSQSGFISADGRYVTFLSEATNLVPGDTNGRDDVFVRDRQTGQTTRVSVASDGSQSCACAAAGVGGEVTPVISADGSLVVFASTAPAAVGGGSFGPLVPGDTNGELDVFVHDRSTATTSRVSVASDGTQGNARSGQPSISADGRYVAFSSRASNLVANDTNGTPLSGTDIFVRDRQTGQTTRVSVSSAGTEAIGDSFVPSISADGRYVAFESTAHGLVVGDQTARERDIYVHDRQTSTTTLVSKASDGTLANDNSTVPTISADGRHVAFVSHANNLVAGDTNTTPDVFVHDRQTGTTALVHKASDGTQGSGRIVGATISAGGHHVAFASEASNLVTGDTNDKTDVFVHDRQTGLTTLVSRAGPTQPGNNNSNRPTLSGDGSTVAFSSGATNLVPGDTNGVSDVFVTGSAQLPVVSVGDVAVHEGDAGTRAATFSVTLTEPSTAAVTVAYATAAASAGAGDFAAQSGTLSFAPGVSGLTVKVPVSGDTAGEADEAFSLVLSTPSGAVIADGTGVGTILDDDPATITGRRLAIGDVAVHEGDAGARVAVFNVSLSKASTSYVTVSFATAKATATVSDFAAKSGTLSFAPGTTSVNVKVPITPDKVREGEESFTVKLSGASGATIADAVGLGTILDND